MSEPTLWLHSSCLLSKFGFNDGDMPDEVADWLDAQGIDFNGTAWRAEVLGRLVREHLVPALARRVTIVEIGTNHNPIRASTVDDVDVEGCWYGGQPSPVLTPESVEVPYAEVLRVLREVGGVLP